jgi:hypothetical protein
MLPLILEQLTRDARQGLRQIGRYPGFSYIAITTLALGIGVNTAIFSAFDAVLMRPLPYADPGRQPMVWDDMRSTGYTKHFTTPAKWDGWRRNNTVFSEIAATESLQAILAGEGEPEELVGRLVTANLWRVLGTPPLLGRVFTDDEERRGARLAVISYSLWQRPFGGAPDMPGRKTC